MAIPHGAVECRTAFLTVTAGGARCDGDALLAPFAASGVQMCTEVPCNISGRLTLNFCRFPRWKLRWYDSN